MRPQQGARSKEQKKIALNIVCSWFVENAASAPRMKPVAKAPKAAEKHDKKGIKNNINVC
jgi:hypothetical protein